MLSFSSKTRNAFCSAFSAALCFIWPLVSKADTNTLTQAQIQAAFVAALKEYAEYSSGQDYLLPTVPVGTESSGSYLMQYLIAIPTDDVTPSEAGVGRVLYQQMRFLAPLIQNILAANTNIVSRLELLHHGQFRQEAIQVEDSELYSEMWDIRQAIGAIQSTLTDDSIRVELDANTSTNGLEVSDEITHDKLDNIIGLVDEILSKKPYDIELWVSLVEGNTEINNNLENIASLLETSHGDLSNIENYAGQLVGHKDTLEAADQNADSTFESAYIASEGDRDNQEVEAASEYDSIPMSDVSDDGYVPDISQLPDEPADSADLGLGNQSVREHNALIRLYTPLNRPSEPDDPPPIPAVEIDWGRDQVLNREVDKFSTFFAWFYPILGTGFLSAKALMMFRKCKLATTARAANPWEPPDPYVTLAWDPF